MKILKSVPGVEELEFFLLILPEVFIVLSGLMELDFRTEE